MEEYHDEDRVYKKPEPTHNKVFITKNAIAAEQKSKKTLEDKQAYYCGDDWKHDYEDEKYADNEKIGMPPPRHDYDTNTIKERWDMFLSDNKIQEIIPEAETTLWNAEIISLAQAKIDFNRNMALFFASPSSIAAMYQAIISAWQSIRSNFKTHEKLLCFYEEMNTRITNCRLICWEIMKKYHQNEDIPIVDLEVAGDYYQQTWDMVWDALASLNALLLFRKKKGYEIVLQGRTRSKSLHEFVSGNME